MKCSAEPRDRVSGLAGDQPLGRRPQHARGFAELGLEDVEVEAELAEQPFDRAPPDARQAVRRLREVVDADRQVARAFEHGPRRIGGRKTAQEKIASFIAMAGRRAGLLEAARPLDGQLFELPLSREDMAEYLSLTIETVSRQLGRLRREGLIDLISVWRLVVRDYAALLEAAGDDHEVRVRD